MTDDTTLDGFGGGDGEDEIDAENSPKTDTEPAQSTYAWSPTGESCEACGTTVERRWRDDGILVCEDCKEW